MAERHLPIDETAMARLLAWINGIDLPMFVLRHYDDDSLLFVHANSALERVAGVPASVFPGKSTFDIFPPRLAGELDGKYRRCLARSEPYSYEECMMLDGQETWWQTTLSKPAGFGGRVVLGVAVTITNQKRREFEAAEALAEMSARFDELRLFSTMAAHDARSPLATVSSLIEIVLDDFRDMGDGKTELLRLIGSTADEALDQISATLERGRNLKAGCETVRRVDLGRLCGDIAAMVDPEMRLAIDLPAGQVDCDEVMVQMGVRNLMSNAARYCDHSIAVHVSADPDRRMIRVDVSDDGPGLPEGTTLQDLTHRGEARIGAHGFGLNAIAQLTSSRGGAFEILPPEPDAPDGGLPGARFRMTLPGQIVGGASAVPTIHSANSGSQKISATG